MLFKELGKTGVQIPEVGMGTWQYHGGAEPLRQGLAAGARLIVTAGSYGSEPVAHDPSGALNRLGKATGRTTVPIALNWCLCQNGVVVSPKSNQGAHVLENCGASGWRLAPEQIRELDQAVSIRCRSRLEIHLRRALPPELKTWVRNLNRFPAGALRRKPQ